MDSHHLVVHLPIPDGGAHPSFLAFFLAQPPRVHQGDLDGVDWVGRPRSGRSPSRRPGPRRAPQRLRRAPREPHRAPRGAARRPPRSCSPASSRSWEGGGAASTASPRPTTPWSPRASSAGSTPRRMRVFRRARDRRGATAPGTDAGVRAARAPASSAMTRRRAGSAGVSGRATASGTAGLPVQEDQELRDRKSVV